MVNRCARSEDHEDLRAERANCPFDTHELAARIYGSWETLRKRHRILDFVLKTPELRDLKRDFSHLTRLQRFHESYKNAAAAERHMNAAINREDADKFAIYERLTTSVNGHPFMLKHVIVIPLLENACTDEQRAMFLEPAKRHEWPSAYAQTELGHGTNVNKIETTATYDPTTEEFVLNTPTRTSFKWWPGNLAKSAAVAIVMAQLHTQNKSYGMHPFVVRIRDEETHEPLPGVIVGDIGPKFDNDTNDNGFLGFKNFRIPRMNMLMKHSKVHPDGRFEPPKHPHLAYIGMGFVRANICLDCGLGLAEAATIAVRYSCIRRQGEIEKNAGEVKILDYQTQQYRVLPQVARAVAFCISGHHSRSMYGRVIEEIKTGNFALMADLHALTAGLKAVVSFQAAVGVEQCRLACGGHGYSRASGLPALYARVVPACTYEGENLVMLLQLARYLVKHALGGQQKGRASNEITRYLHEGSPAHSNFSSEQPKAAQWSSIQAAFEHVARRQLRTACSKLLRLQKSGVQPAIAWNQTSVDLTKAARSHTRTFLSRNFIRAVVEEKTADIQNVLGDLLSLYLHYELLECRADLLENGFMTSQQVDESRKQLEAALEAVRPNAVNIVDSFDFPDISLQSVLGRSDGHVYEHLLKWAQKSELNQHDVLPFHHSTVGRIMKGKL